MNLHEQLVEEINNLPPGMPDGKSNKVRFSGFYYSNRADYANNVAAMLNMPAQYLRALLYKTSLDGINTGKLIVDIAEEAFNGASKIKYNGKYDVSPKLVEALKRWYSSEIYDE